jgi:hypothetical protein
VEVAEIMSEVEGVVSVGPPKTRASRRTVGLPRRVVGELEHHLARHVDNDPAAFVFTAPQGGPLRVSAFRARIWRPATVAAGLDQVRIHDLRHTAVALWIAAGASPKEVAARAGHTSVRVVLDTYGGLYPEQDTGLRDRLDAMFTDASEGQVLTLDRGASGPKVVPGSSRAPPRGSGRRSDLLVCLVGATGFEPVTSSVSANGGEALCGSPFPQVAANRRW